MLFHSCLKIVINVYLFFCTIRFSVLSYFTFGVLTGNNDTIKGLELMVFHSSPVGVVFILTLLFSLDSAPFDLFLLVVYFRLSLSPSSPSLHLSFTTNSNWQCLPFAFPWWNLCLLLKLRSFPCVLFGSISGVFPTSGIKQSVEWYCHFWIKCNWSSSPTW